MIRWKGHIILRPCFLVCHDLKFNCIASFINWSKRNPKKAWMKFTVCSWKKSIMDSSYEIPIPIIHQRKELFSVKLEAFLRRKIPCINVTKNPYWIHFKFAFISTAEAFYGDKGLSFLLSNFFKWKEYMQMNHLPKNLSIFESKYLIFKCSILIYFSSDSFGIVFWFQKCVLIK